MVINEYVEVTGNPKNYKRYIELGYDIKINEKILIKEKDLSNSSTIIVERKCDCCGGNIYIIKIGTDIFYQCSSCGSLTKSVPIEEVRIYTSK